MSLCSSSYLCQRWGASPALLRLPRSASASILEFISVFVVVIMFVSEVGRVASLALLASLGARFRSRNHICLRDCSHVCVRGGAPREPRLARLARRPLSFWSSYVPLCLYLCLFQGPQVPYKALECDFYPGLFVTLIAAGISRLSRNFLEAGWPSWRPGTVFLAA